MPPKKKRRAPGRPQSPPPQEQQPERSASPSQNSEHEEDSRSASAADDEPIPQLFNTAFATYRVSPLHISAQQPLTAPHLQTLSRRLRDLVVGDAVRGVQVGGLGGGLESDATLGRAGALEHVVWQWVALERLLGGSRATIHNNTSREGSLELGTPHVEPEERRNRRGRPAKSGRTANGGVGATQGPRHETEGGGEEPSALCLELSYENSTFHAMLLPNIASESTNKDTDVSKLPWIPRTTKATAKEQSNQQQQQPSTFLHLPLLILKLPAPLKPVLIDFLSSTFDCRVSPLRLGTRTLVRCWEDWLTHHDRSSARRQQHKDVTLTLGFHLEPLAAKDSTDKAGGGETVPLGLKSLDVVVPATEIVRFLRAGQEIASQAVEASGTGDARPQKSKQKQPQSTTTTKRKHSDAFPAQEEKGDTESHRRLRRQLAGGRDDEGWEWRRQNSSLSNHDARAQQPFTEALASYLSSHLALDLFHPGVRIQRVACAGFTLAETGRVRIARPRPVSLGRAPDPDDASADGGGAGAVWDLVQELVSKAKGGEWSADAVKLARLVVGKGEEEGRKGGVG